MNNCWSKLGRARKTAVHYTSMNKIKLMLGESPWGLQIVVLELIITPVGSSFVPKQPESSRLHIRQHPKSHRQFRYRVQKLREDLRTRLYWPEVGVRNPNTDVSALSHNLNE